MIEYEKIDIIEGIDVEKTNKSKECMLCHYWYFLNKNFSYGPYICDGCYNISQKSKDFKNIAIVHIKKMHTEFTFNIKINIKQKNNNNSNNNNNK